MEEIKMEGRYALADPTSGITVLNMNNEFNLFGRRTYLIGRTFKTYLPIDDAIVEKALVVPKEKEKGSLGKLLVGVAVAAALMVAAVVVVATGGLRAALIGVF